MDNTRQQPTKASQRPQNLEIERPQLATANQRHRFLEIVRQQPVKASQRRQNLEIARQQPAKANQMRQNLEITRPQPAKASLRHQNLDNKNQLCQSVVRKRTTSDIREASRVAALSRSACLLTHSKTDAGASPIGTYSIRFLLSRAQKNSSASTSAVQAPTSTAPASSIYIQINLQGAWDASFG